MVKVQEVQQEMQGGGFDPGQPIIEAITSWTDHATQLGVMKVGVWLVVL